ncbi:hypothetical protein [Mesoflavibacter sp. SCSIO 43206]|uniref:hypothetical protein n=1 Tax=Mesoflavibacter sp. SCSIO 43206 TaxID=2779362 RepID=UPI001CA94F85|nr:hypothetical protein [Mesoflavibacter sp. SCSIO 43206]UAB75141.1 hypothetical protein INR78_12225 [Mesoflavibacter sp. SCSIO 43206]
MLTNVYGSTFVKDIQHVIYNDMDQINRSDKNVVFYGSFNEEMQLKLGEKDIRYYLDSTPILFSECLPLNFDYQFIGYKIIVSDIQKLIGVQQRESIKIVLRSFAGSLLPYQDFIIKDVLTQSDYISRTDKNGEANFYKLGINPANPIQAFLTGESNDQLEFAQAENTDISFGEFKDIADQQNFVLLSTIATNER